MERPADRRESIESGEQGWALGPWTGSGSWLWSASGPCWSMEPADTTSRLQARFIPVDPFSLSLSLRLPAVNRRLVKDKLFPQAIDYLQKVLSVRHRVGRLLLGRQCASGHYLRKKDDPHRYCHGACAELTRCGPVIVPQHHLQQCKVCSESGPSCGPQGPLDGPGVEGSDFILYVSGVTTERCGQENIVAYAAYCQLEATVDRPVAGYANLCPSMISSQPQEFEGMLATVKHEVIHALGFSAGLFAFFHDDEGKPLTPRPVDGALPVFNKSLGVYQWSEAVVRSVSRLWDVRGGHMVRHQVHLLVTPRVVEEARRHFNCPILEGMELENQGGAGTQLNHWEKRLLENEAMTGSHTQNRVFSRLTLALMEDTGWYHANYSHAQRLDWGRGLGCDFVMKSCKFWMDKQRQRRVPVTPFCDMVSQEFSWHLSGEYQRNSYCRVPENQPEWWRNYAAERYGPDSVCVYQRSAFSMEQCDKKMIYPDWGSGCYKLISVSVRLSGWVYNGVLVCPACSDLCDLCPEQTTPLNTTRSAPIDPCSRSPGLALTFWLLLVNLVNLVPL
ncbi:hypothetical protein NHX12_007596 [Muraenolepis orangiensis]|uniref:Leishmanolysin-like peptidase n=1 Tax=Muraenolepis orangiensis TaxID=630683 RepID=A0A9Q0DQ54_9TELE|nr:hypothetical protein NHX12_007596 [Muraenolepis orangiensis]